MALYRMANGYGCDVDGCEYCGAPIDHGDRVVWNSRTEKAFCSRTCANSAARRLEETPRP